MIFPFRRFTNCVIAAVFLLSLSACAFLRTPEVGDTVLWVLTEESTSDGMNYQAALIAERMEEAHDGLTVKIEVLPADEQEREATLKRIRAKIMAGSGPDVYLLPTDDTLTLDYASQYIARKTREIKIEPLFLDVMQAMYSGVFLDIEEFYSSDQALGKEALFQQIMDAGVLGQRRYVLPLRYDVPVIFTDPDKWESFGITQELMDSDMITLIGSILCGENGATASGGIQLPADFTFIPQLFNYEKEEILVSPQSIADYMRLYQQWRISVEAATDMLIEEAKSKAILAYIEELRPLFQDYVDQTYNEMSIYNDIGRYFCRDVHWSTAGLPVFTSHLTKSLDNIAIERLEQISKSPDRQLPAYPLRTANGSTVASVTYWGAIGSSCENPAIAYTFLRQFLEEEFQWGEYRPREDKSRSRFLKEVQAPGQVENSWPVRTQGSVSHLWDIVQYQVKLNVDSAERDIASYLSRQVQIMEFTDEDLPALSWEIDEVRFPITLTGEDSMEYALSLLNEADGTPTDVDIDALAEKVWQNLWWHLAEG